MTTAERLRALADYYEVHPNAPLPYEFKSGNKFIVVLTKFEFAKQIKNIGSFEKVYDDSFLNLQVKVADYIIEYYTQRENVCERKVVGKKLVAAEVVPAIFTPEKFIPEHEEDIIEWDCPEALLETLAEKES